MNIFYLDNDPIECAKLHCDKHVVKMCIEYAQLLSTAHRVLDGKEYVDKNVNGRRIKRWKLEHHENLIYKACHINHPSTVWTRSNLENYMWLYRMWCALGDEYTHRYGKKHACLNKLKEVLSSPPNNIRHDSAFYEPPPAMKQYPQCIVVGDSVVSYHNYYREAKARFAKWTNRLIPTFMVNEHGKKTI